MLQTQWNNVEEGKRMHLREVVFTFLLGRNPPHFVLTKLIKILVDIGKLDWPERYPDFLKHILHTISNEKYQHFGVLLLKILIEEFTTNNSRQSVPVTGNRQRQILSSFLQNIPVIIETMTTTLLNLYGKLQHASSSGNNNIANQISSQCHLNLIPNTIAFQSNPNHSLIILPKDLKARGGIHTSAGIP